MLAERWWLSTDGEPDLRVRFVEVHRHHAVVAPELEDASTFALAADLTRATTVPLPTDRLRPA